MGLFEDVWDWVKSKVQYLINASLASFKYWVNAAIKTAINAVDWVINNVTNFIDNSIQYINDSINYWGDQITQFIDNSLHYIDDSINYWGDQVTNYITNVTNNFTEYVTNNSYKTIKYVTNVIGALDPFGFLKDPQGYIKGVFDLLIAPWGHGLIKSFWEGFEEGQA